MITEEILEALDKAEREATLGPWHVSNEVDIDTNLDGDERYCEWMSEITAKHEEDTEYLSLLIQSCGLHRFAKPNADLIALTRNHLRALLDGYRELKGIAAEKEELRIRHERLRAENIKLETELNEARSRVESVGDKLATMMEENERLRTPYCLGEPTIRTVAKDGQLALESGHAFIAASDIYQKDPYTKIEHLRAENAKLQAVVEAARRLMYTTRVPFSLDAQTLHDALAALGRAQAQDRTNGRDEQS